MNLKKIKDNIIKGQIIRSKVKWHEEGERNSKYFLGLEKNNAVKKSIRKLKLNNGITTTNQDDILKEQVTFFKKLYTSKQDGNYKDTTGLFDHVTKIDDDDKLRCEGLINVSECEYVLKTFKDNKAPGNDGISAEFYKYF